MSAQPNGWESIALGTYFEVVRGASPRPKGDPRYFGGSIPWISIKDINAEPGKYLTKTVEGVTEAGAEKSRLLPPGSLILSNSASVCIPKILKVQGCIHDGFVTFPRLEALCDVRYFYYLFDSMRPLVIDKHRQGVTQVNLNTDIVRGFEIPLAPLPEQKRIADKLDSVLARVDTCRDRLDRLPALLKRFRRSILDAATSGRLTKDWRNQPEISVTEKHVPASWTICKIKDAGKIQLGRQRSPKFHSGENMRPYLRVQNVFEDRLDLSDVMSMDFPGEDFARYLLHSGDILLNEGQSPEYLGRPAMYRGEFPGACFTNTLIRFQAYSHVKPEYALMVFRNHMHSGRYITEGTITTNIAHLGAGRFSEVEFPLPPQEEQTEIVRRVEILFAFADRLEAHLATARRQVGQLTPTLLAKAFRGELVAQDPADEPAAELLKRLAAQHETAPKMKRSRKIANL